MKIDSAEYVMSEVSLDRFPQDGLFEVCLIGKSNVGKSSFINSFVQKKGLARTSSQPGKTRTANFYLINENFYFVDMPGYGYAKVSKSLKMEFDKILKDYLRKRDCDFIVLMLIDHRHTPTKNDVEMYQFILSCGINPVIVLTKSDKVKRSERVKCFRSIKSTLNLDDDDLIMPYSIESRGEIKQVRDFISSIVYEEDGANLDISAQKENITE